MDVSWNSFNSMAMLKINYLIFWICLSILLVFMFYEVAKATWIGLMEWMLSVFKMLQSAFQMIFGTQKILTSKYSYIEYFKLLIKILFWKFKILMYNCIKIRVIAHRVGFNIAN
jgi:hypothetical protein